MKKIKEKKTTKTVTAKKINCDFCKEDTIKMVKCPFCENTKNVVMKGDLLHFCSKCKVYYSKNTKIN